MLGSIVFTLLPAGHSPGLYVVSSEMIIRTVAGAGNIVKTVGYTSTGGAVTSVATATSLISTGRAGGATFYSPVVIYSVGTADVTITFASNGGVTGSPSMDVFVAINPVAIA